MKVIILFFLFYWVHLGLNAQIKSGKVFECINKPILEVSHKVQVESFPFWLKFCDNKFRISNSNNLRIASMAGIWTYMSGHWKVTKDTLILHVTETRHFSTNTGSFIDNNVTQSLYHDKKGSKIIRFVFSWASESVLTLDPLDSFLGFEIEEPSKFKPPFIFYLDIDQKLTMKETDNKYQFNTICKGQ